MVLYVCEMYANPRRHKGRVGSDANHHYSPFLFKRQSGPSVLSKLSRAGNAEDPIRKPAY